MDLFGIEIGYLLIGVVLASIIISAVLSVVGGVLIHHVWKKKKTLFPRMTMVLLNLLETPIKNGLWFFGFDTKDMLRVRSDINNVLYRTQFAAVPFIERVIFLPQCLRNQKCPAPTDEEGLQCKECGLCNIKEYKREAEKLGYRFFIAPGGTMVKRMIKKYRPKAVIGVGCENEIQMGAEMAIRAGVVPQVVPLLRNGCVNTLVDWDELRKITYMTTDNMHD